MHARRLEGSVRQMPEMSQDKRKCIFERMHEIRSEIGEEYQAEIFLVTIAKALKTGNRDQVLKLLSKNPSSKTELFSEEGKHKPAALIMLRLIKELYLEEVHTLSGKDTLDTDDVETFHKSRDAKLARFHARLVVEAPSSYRLLSSALKILPQVMMGQVPASDYSSKFVWLGSESPSVRPGKVILALSGGSAKGVFYLGFVKALRENGLWPDIVIGSSAGAIAAAALGSGRDLEAEFSPTKLSKIFNPLLAPLTLLRSKGSGVLAYGLGDYLRGALGDATMSHMADVFLVSTIQQPVGFGKAVMGYGSPINKGISLGSDIPLWKAAWGSASIQGIIPPPKLDHFHAERLSEGEFGPTLDRLDLPYATLDDGAAVEYLPMITSELLLRELGKEGLIIGVNLANLNPMSSPIPDYLSLKQRVNSELAALGEDASMYRKASAVAKAFRGWVRQEWNGFVNQLAPMRAFKAYDATAYTSIMQCVNLVKGNGSKILINPNSDGFLDSVNLTSLGKSTDLINYGYELGTHLCELLIGKSEERRAQKQPTAVVK